MHELLKSTGNKPRKGTVEPCGFCGKDVYRRASEAGKRRFCSTACKSAAQIQDNTHTCAQCGVTYRTPESVRHTFCSWRCYLESIKVDKGCAVCGNALSVSARTYCSPACSAAGQRTGAEVPCEICGTPFYVKAHDQGVKRYCSIVCHSEAMRIDGMGSRYLRRDGYISVYYPKHPDASSNRQVMEHRLVMETVIGRRLTKDEQVHHINGIRNDNRPENLELIAPDNHTRITNQIAKKKRLGAAEELALMRAELAAYRQKYGPLDQAG